jgi:exonuclease III
MPRGYGGTAILWRKDIDTIVTSLTIDNNRMQCTEITGDPNLLITSIYLPCKGSPNSQDEFQECIDQLHEIMSTYEQTYQVIIGGDFNEEITNINTTTRQQYVVEFMAEHQMYTKEMGPTFINATGKDCTSIDYILFQESYREQISSIKKIDVIANVSDHYPILLTLRYKKPIDKNQKPAHTQKTNNK